ncbi:MAG TPA: two-component regulator propeller domain-containing protein, partial [Rhodothermales bacterium]|nr:two-component regulator propeller domain-containing protein [Rhodothermales bacterium]
MEFSPVLHAFARRVALVLLVAFGAASAAHGQGAGLPSRQNRLQRLTMDDGLPQSTVLALTQDRDGFMWLGTEDGLARYDGYALTPYRADPLDSTALPSGRITRLAGSYDGALWVGTNGGLVRLDPATGLVRRFQHRPGDSTTLAQSPVLSLLEDRGGTVFVGFAEGLSRLDPLTGRATNYPADFRDTATLTCPISLYQSVDGGLWAGTWNGVARVDRRTGALQRYLQRSGGYDCDRSVGAAAIALVEDPAARGVLWIATDSGLVRLDTRTGASRRWLPAPGRATGSPEGGANELRDLAWDPAEAGVLWVGTSGGLFRFVVA